MSAKTLVGLGSTLTPIDSAKLIHAGGHHTH